MRRQAFPCTERWARGLVPCARPSSRRDEYRFGSAARGVVFTMLGFFILQAALRYDPNQAQGLDGALRTIAQQPYGPWLLAIVALGLVSFGIYSVLCARWIEITKPDRDQR